METVGKRISMLRKKYGYSQEKLAELANISIQFLSDIENNKKSMSITTLRSLADCLCITTDYIIYGSENNDNTTKVNSMLNSLSDQQKLQAEKMLTIFIDAINDNDAN